MKGTFYLLSKSRLGSIEGCKLSQYFNTINMLAYGAHIYILMHILAYLTGASLIILLS